MDEINLRDALFMMLLIAWCVLMHIAAAEGDVAREILYAASGTQWVLIWILCELKR